MLQDLVLVMLHKFQSAILRRLLFQSGGTALRKMQCVSSKDDLQISTTGSEIMKQQCQKCFSFDTAVLLFGGVYHGGGGIVNSYASGLKFVSALQPSSHFTEILRSPWAHAIATRQLAVTSQNSNSHNNVVDEEEDDEETEGSELEDEDGDDEETEGSELEDEDGGTGEEIQEKPAKPPKQKPSEPKGGFLNEAIMARTVRLVSDARDHNVVSREEALRLAKKKNLDLVMVDARANPPVCKIFDYHREEYKQEKIKKERKKKKGDMVRLNDVKELRFTSKTELKDLKMKVEKAKQFMDHGHRVKFVAIHGTGGLQGELIDKIFPLIEDVAVIEQGPRVERVSSWVMLRHVKFGPVKKKPPKTQPLTVVSEQLEVGEEGHADHHLGSADSDRKSDDNQNKLPLHPQNPLQRSTQKLPLHPQNPLQRSTQTLATKNEEGSTPKRFSRQL